MSINKRLIIFCKEPNAGRIKTRLQTALNSDQIKTLYCNIILYLLNSYSAKQDFSVVLYCYPTVYHPFFLFCKENYKIDVKQQNGLDLGERMYNAFCEELTKFSRVLLIGSDCPELTSDYISNAFDQLINDEDIVISPSYDGGYALIGIHTTVNKNWFEVIKWSTNTVLQETIDKIHNKYNIYQLSYVRDIDDIEDYAYFLRKSEYQFLSQAHLLDYCTIE